MHLRITARGKAFHKIEVNVTTGNMRYQHLMKDLAANLCQNISSYYEKMAYHEE